MNQLKTEWIDKSLAEGTVAKHGLRRPPSSNTCFFNSLMIALRSLVEVLRTVLSDGMLAYYQKTEFEGDALHAFHALLKSMHCQKFNNDKETEKNRAQMVDALIKLAEDIDMAAGTRPIERNQQGDPNELLLYLVGWFEKSLESMENEANSNRDPQVFLAATASGNRLIELLNNMMPLMSDFARCPCGHRMGRAEKSFVWISIDDKCSSVKQCLDNYFAAEIFDARCSSCGKMRSMNKCVRLEELPGDIFAVGIRLFTNILVQVKNLLKNPNQLGY